MGPVEETRRDLVLVGGGHSHALALRMLAMKPVAGLRVTLVSPDSHTPYSGMLPGLVAGHYRFEDTHIDLARLCQWAGARFIAARACGLVPASRTLKLDGRPALDYDLLSIDIGSRPELDSVPGAREFATAVKPVAGLWQRWQALHRRVLTGTAGGALRIAVVGGGAGSVELALAMAHRLRGEEVSIDLWCGAREILLGYNRRARHSVSAALARANITVHPGNRVESVEPGRLVFAEGSTAAFDELFWCTGAAAASWIAQSGLPVTGGGFLAVRDTLQSTGDERVFGAGDIATQVDHPRPKAGVYAVRQAPVLAHNLRAMSLGKRLREHRPQSRFLSLLSLGEKRATADRGPFSATGAWVWRWKDRIDREFMARFSELPRYMPGRHWGILPELQGVKPQAPCGGCGAKVGANVLSTVLADLAREFPDLCTGQGDDTAEIPNPGGGSVLQSVDMLRELVADHWLMGRIAANHALSDLYASGARPLSAQALVTLPFAGPRILQRDLYQLLAGALHEFAAVGCRLNGGHSMQGPELGIGFVVNGRPLADDGQLLPKRGLVPGDRLILTKPLGTGVLFAAQMQLAADGRDIQAAVDVMLSSNLAAAEHALAAGASACTDVTGFSLLGHLSEMLDGKLGARLELSRVPLLAGALELAHAGITSSAYEANRESVGEPDVSGNPDSARLGMLYDPQTSGGLLVGIAPDAADEFLAALREAGYGAAQIIGEVISSPAGRRIELV